MPAASVPIISHSLLFPQTCMQSSQVFERRIKHPLDDVRIEGSLWLMAAERRAPNHDMSCSASGRTVVQDGLARYPKFDVFDTDDSSKIIMMASLAPASPLSARLTSKSRFCWNDGHCSLQVPV